MKAWLRRLFQRRERVVNVYSSGGCSIKGYSRKDVLLLMDAVDRHPLLSKPCNGTDKCPRHPELLTEHAKGWPT